MIWSFITQLITFVLDLLTLSRAADKTKEFELLVLRQQIRILERRLGKRVRRRVRQLHTRSGKHMRTEHNLFMVASGFGAQVDQAESIG